MRQAQWREPITATPGRLRRPAPAAGGVLDDPFGDRLAQQEPPPLPAAGALPESEFPPLDGDAPELDPLEPSIEPMSPRNARDRDDEKCDEKYAGVEFCQNRERCEELIANLRQNNLRSQSLDELINISPPDERVLRDRTIQIGDKPQPKAFSLLAEREWTIEGKDVFGSLDLKASSGRELVVNTDEAPLRVDAGDLTEKDRFFVYGRSWRDRNGRQLAFGRFGGLVQQQVLITTFSGDLAAAAEDPDAIGPVTARLPYNDLAEDELQFVSAYYRLPYECVVGRGLTEQSLDFPERPWNQITFAWKASGVCHKPLYFEQYALERYGHTIHPLFQPAFSGAHFFGSIAVLPYQMGIHPPHECVYPLGYYRPGSCAPWLVPPAPLSGRGAAAQAAFVTGAVFVLP